MFFWIGIIIALCLAYLAVQIGFYESWAMLINMIIASFLAIFLVPALKTIPGAGNSDYSNCLILSIVGVGGFFILQGISYLLITGQFKVTFPRVLDALCSGIVGFLSGFLAWSFVCLIIYCSPISNDSLMKNLGFEPEVNLKYVCWFSDRVNNLVANVPVSTNSFIGDHLSYKTKPRKKTESNEPSKIGTEDPNNARFISGSKNHPDDKVPDSNKDSNRPEGNANTPNSASN